MFSFQMISNTVKNLSIQYIALVYSDDVDGHESTEELEILLNDTVCIGGKFSVNDNDIIIKLIRLQTNLPSSIQNLPVVYVGNSDGAERLVAEAARDSHDQGSSRFLWIFGGGVGADTFTGYSKIARNTISVVPRSIEVQEFSSYWSEELERFYFQSNDPLPHQWYYQEYIYDLYACSPRIACLQQGVNNFDQKYKQTPFLNMALDAAYTFANALKVSFE